MIDGSGALGRARSLRWTRLITPVLAAWAALLLGAGVATARTAQTYPLHGAEYAFTSTQGSFAGSAELPNQRPGTFNAVVPHTVLDPNATITPGGSFTIFGPAGRVSGRFSGGFITELDGFTGCQNQHFKVAGDITSAGGPERFQVTLTHYQSRLGSHCVTYFATVTGTATVTGATLPTSQQ